MVRIEDFASEHEVLPIHYELSRSRQYTEQAVKDLVVARIYPRDLSSVPKHIRTLYAMACAGIEERVCMLNEEIAHTPLTDATLRLVENTLFAHISWIRKVLYIDIKLTKDPSYAC